MKVGIIGAGLVGSTAAYTLALEGAASEIVLVDLNKNLAQAHAEDILHATPYGYPAKIYAGDYDSLSSAKVVILSCGVGQKEGESRLELLGRNARVFEEVIPKVMNAANDALLLVASNPVDIITQVVTRISALPPDRVIGSGTILDTARFRSLVGNHLGVSARSVHAYVVGEHGDSEVLIWSSPQIGGVSLLDFADQIGRPITGEVQAEIDDGVRNAAARIIRGKGATYHGIGGGLSRIIRAIRDNEGAVLSVSSRCHSQKKYEGICFSLPRIVGAQGIVSELWPPLNDEEQQALQRSTAIIADAARELGY
ncbi:MAG: L-lactate dehydrogenase [Desulfocapsaceae bacterium]|nr:L-lactate dehydrogenase [Desulfocapsaceae bacterium]